MEAEGFLTDEEIPGVEVEVLDEAAVAVKAGHLKDDLTVRTLLDLGIHLVEELLILFYRPDVRRIVFCTQGQAADNHDEVQPPYPLAHSIYRHGHQDKSHHRDGIVEAILILAYSKGKGKHDKENEGERCCGKRPPETADYHRERQNDDGGSGGDILQRFVHEQSAS